MGLARLARNDLGSRQSPDSEIQSVMRIPLALLPRVENEDKDARPDNAAQPRLTRWFAGRQNAHWESVQSPHDEGRFLIANDGWSLGAGFPVE